MKNEIMRLENLTKGQLIYLRDLATHDELVEWMCARWEYKFNYGKLTENDLKKFHNECDILKVESIKVLAEMQDYFLI